MSVYTGKRDSMSLPVNFCPSLLRGLNRGSMESVMSINGSCESGDDYRYAEVSHPAQMLAGLQTLRRNSKLCDVTLCVDGREFPCHRCVLAAFSSYFEAMFSGNMVESQQNKVTINGIESSILEKLLDYAYTSEITINRQNVQNLLAASNLLEIMQVKEACCHYLEQNMDETNVVGIHCFAEIHACDDLQQKSRDFILQNFTAVSQNEEFNNLSQSKLTELLSDDELIVDSEETVYEAAMRWLDHSSENRLGEFHHVLECVRLPMINPYYLHDFVEQNDVIKSCELCKKLVDEAKNFHLLPDRRTEFNNKRTRIRKSAGMYRSIHTFKLYLSISIIGNQSWYNTATLLIINNVTK